MSHQLNNFITELTYETREREKTEIMIKYIKNIFL